MHRICPGPACGGNRPLPELCRDGADGPKFPRVGNRRCLRWSRVPGWRGRSSRGRRGSLGLRCQELLLADSRRHATLRPHRLLGLPASICHPLVVFFPELTTQEKWDQMPQKPRHPNPIMGIRIPGACSRFQCPSCWVARCQRRFVASRTPDWCRPSPVPGSIQA